MPTPPNRLLRTVVPIVMGLMGLGVAIAVLRTGKPPATNSPPAQSAAQPANQPSASPSAQPAPGQTSSAQPIAPSAGEAARQPSENTSSPSAGAPQAATTGAGQPAGNGPLRARSYPPATAADLKPLGSLDDATGMMAQVKFSPVGAGIASIDLSRHFETWKRQQPLVLQQDQRVTRQTDAGTVVDTMTPFSALYADVNGQVVNLAYDAAGPVWRPGESGKPGDFEAYIVDAKDTPVLRLERRYELDPATYDLRLYQTVTNLTNVPIRFRWHQVGPVDLAAGGDGYGGDKRRLRFGYLLNSQMDPAQTTVVSNGFVIPRAEMLGGKSGQFPISLPQWPNAKSQADGFTLSWVGMTNRYFGVAVHSLIAPDAAPTAGRALAHIAEIDRILIPTVVDGKPDAVAGLKLSSDELTLPGQGSAELNLGVYAGPLDRKILKASPAGSALGLDGLVVYNLGGPCGICTFEFMTSILLGLLRFLHDSIFHDWSLAIMTLVVIVRTCLHPVTKWSQVRMQRFAKQMQGMAPKQKKIQERYKDDPKQMQAEMAKLWREEGISPFGMLGCLPMFLQTPVWMALYATLYFAVELRHEPAFYGLFQSVTSGKWGFLADLSHPDHAIDLGRTITVPILSSMVGPISAINILPLLLGAVFFVHQKYLTPPTTTPLTPEQESQQRIIKIMSVVMFPLFMYNAPSGLSLYFITNSTLGIFENKWIRAHIDKHGLLSEENLKRKPKAEGSFFQRMTQLAEAKRNEAERRAREAQKAGQRRQR